MSVSTEIFYVFFQANFTNKVGSGWISVKEADARRCCSVQILDLILDYESVDWYQAIDLFDNL